MEIDNGLTNRVFTIPKQITFVHAATSIETNGNFIPIDFRQKFDQKMSEAINNSFQKTLAVKSL